MKKMQALSGIPFLFGFLFLNVVLTMEAAAAPARGSQAEYNQLIRNAEKELAAESEEQRTAKLVEGAKKEGKLLWYTAANVMESEMILKKFKAKYPFIETQIFRANAEKLLIKLLSEHQAQKNIWDVTKVGGIRSVLLKQKGLFAKYISHQWRFISNDFKDPEGYWTSIYLGLLVTVYNTRLVTPKEVPKTWVDLLAPKWKGKMGMPTDSYEWFANMFKIMGENKGVEYMKKLAEQNIQFRPGPTLNSQLVAAGEVSIGIRLYPQRIEEMKMIREMI